MRTPQRKPGIHTFDKKDPHMTVDKFNDLKKKLAGLRAKLPYARSEVKTHAELGDFSENAAYQSAKARLRSLNYRIDEILDHLKIATIIRPSNSGAIQLGNTVTIKNSEKERVYKILGSSEVDLYKGIISHNSPIGSALLGRRVGDKVIIKLKDKEVEYEIIKIE